MSEAITQAELMTLLNYCPNTGVFTWRVAKSNQAAVGDPAGAIQSKGYVQITLNRRKYMLHRLAWLYVHGRWPNGFIDHINGNSSDNRIENLREASRSENGQNVKAAPKTNTAGGLLGVHRIKGSDKWRAKIQVNKKTVSLGRFESPEQAHAAYLKAKADLHPYQTIVEKTNGIS